VYKRMQVMCAVHALLDALERLGVITAADAEHLRQVTDDGEPLEALDTLANLGK